jgi:hypothetical protein
MIAAYGIVAWLQIGRYPRHVISLFFRLLYPWYWPSSCWNFVMTCAMTLYYYILNLLVSTWESLRRPSHRRTHEEWRHGNRISTILCCCFVHFSPVFLQVSSVVNIVAFVCVCANHMFCKNCYVCSAVCIGRGQKVMKDVRFWLRSSGIYSFAVPGHHQSPKPCNVWLTNQDGDFDVSPEYLFWTALSLF